MGLEDLVTPGNLEDIFEVGKVIGQVCAMEMNLVVNRSFTGSTTEKAMC